jgi:hypothetical protein
MPTAPMPIWLQEPLWGSPPGDLPARRGWCGVRCCWLPALRAQSSRGAVVVTGYIAVVGVGRGWQSGADAAVVTNVLIR